MGRSSGLTRSGVARLFAIEFALLGLVGAFLGALGACTLAWTFFEHVLDLATGEKSFALRRAKR